MRSSTWTFNPPKSVPPLLLGTMLAVFSYFMGSDFTEWIAWVLFVITLATIIGRMKFDGAATFLVVCAVIQFITGLAPRNHISDIGILLNLLLLFPVSLI